MTASLESDFVISRVFDAPRDLIWKAFTEPGQLMHWWGPKGFAMRVAKLDLRPGGICHFRLQSADGGDMWARFVYREIVPPERIVFVLSFTDEQGVNPTRCPMSATWPLEVLNTMTLSEANGKTTLTLSGVPINATEEERQTFAAGRASMNAGFTGSFDQLEAYLARG